MLLSFDADADADADAVFGAGYGVLTADRVSGLIGYRTRPLDTRVETIDVQVLKLRSGAYFRELLRRRRKRSEPARITVVADCCLAGLRLGR